MKATAVASIAVLIFAGAAHAIPFEATSAGAQALIADIPDDWIIDLDIGGGLGPRLNGAPISFVPGTTVDPDVFSGIWFTVGGTPSAPSPAGLDGMEIFRAGFTLNYQLLEPVNLLIREGAWDAHNLVFDDLGSIVTHDSLGDPLSQPYRLMQYDGAFRSLWIEAIPAPGALGVLAPAALIAARRRRP